MDILTDLENLRKKLAKERKTLGDLVDESWEIHTNARNHLGKEDYNDIYGKLDAAYISVHEAIGRLDYEIIQIVEAQNERM